MKKLLGLATVSLLFASCSTVETMNKITKAVKNFGAPKPATVSESSVEFAKKYDTLRPYIRNYTDKILPIGAERTVVVGRNLNSGVDAIWNVIPKLYAFCKAHGGDLVAGEGLEKVSYEVVNGKPEALKYFGLNTTFRCEGGDYPFEVKHLKGRAGHYSSVLGWIAESILFIKHKPEPMINTPFAFPKNEMDAFAQMTLPQFIDWSYNKKGVSKDLTELGAQKWKAKFYVRKPVPAYIVRPMDDRMGFVWYAIEYCTAQKGELQKDGKRYEEWFTDFAIGEPRLWGYPVSRKYPLAGLYACVNGNQPFEFLVKPLGYATNDFVYSYILEPGTDYYQKKYPVQKAAAQVATPAPQQSQSSAPAAQPQQVPVVNPVYSGGALTKILAARAVATKSDYEKVQGAVKVKVYYNGMDDRGCELASVLVDNGGSQTVYNYRVCNGAISNPVESGLNESIPEEVKRAELEVAKKARDYGSYAATVNGWRIYGKALRDEKKCLVEVRVLEEGVKLVRVDKINACQ